MGIADLFKRWLGLSSDKPAQPANNSKPAPASSGPRAARPDNKSRETPRSRDSRDPGSRGAASNTVPATINVGQLIQKHRMSGASARKAIEQRLGELLVVDTADGNFFRNMDIDRLQAYALFAATPEIRETALSHISDQNVLASIVSEHASSKIRQLAAAQIQDETLLAFAADAIRHKDKGLYKQIRQRLDSVHAEAKTREQQHKALEKLCADMEAQSRQAVSPLFAAKLQSLEQQWRELSVSAAAELTPELQQRFEAATQSARFALAESSRVSEAEERARAEQHAVTEALQARLEVFGETPDWTPAAAFKESLTRLESRWGEALAVISPESGLGRRYDALHKEAGQALKLLEAADPVQTEVSALLATLQETPDQEEALKRLGDVLRPLQLNRQARLPSLLKQARAVLEQARLHAPKRKAPARAEKAARPPKEIPAELLALQEKLAALVQDGHVLEAEKLLKEGRQLARNHKVKSSRLDELGDEVYKLKDWARFAILPKKEALVARMQALVEEETPEPEARQEKIKSIQAEWSALGKMNTEAERLLWKQFQELGERAWEPVKRFLEEQKARETANAERREALCRELQEYLDNMPSEVNWQRHIAIIRTAREEWQRHHPVSPKIHKVLQPRFSGIISALETRLETEYARQEAAKQALILQAAELIESPDIRAACDTAKALQQAWKETGSCGHARDQKLWEEFRTHCDAIFARREEAKTQQRHETQDMIDQAAKLLDQIEEVMATEGGSETASALIEAFESLTLTVPREQQNSLRARLGSIRENLNSQLEAGRKAGFREDVQQLARLMSVCQQAEEAVAAGESVESRQSGWDTAALPATFAEELQKRWAHLERTLEVEPSQQLTLFKQHCLLLEILLDLPSPAEDQEVRISRQMTLFKLQRYPKTTEEKQKLVRNTLRAAIICPSLPAADAPRAMERFNAIIGSEAFLSLF